MPRQPTPRARIACSGPSPFARRTVDGAGSGLVRLDLRGWSAIAGLRLGGRRWRWVERALRRHRALRSMSPAAVRIYLGLLTAGRSRKADRS
jgi:hypothetical protein